MIIYLPQNMEECRKGTKATKKIDDEIKR